MAGPTWAEAATELKNLVKPRTDLEAHFSSQVTNIDTAEQSAEGDFLPERIANGLAGFRAGLSSAVNWADHKADWDAWVLEVLRVAGLPADDAYGRVHRYMHEQTPYTFNGRGWTRGAASAGGSNVGTGVPLRLTVDWEGYSLQGGHVETKTYECVRDQNLGVFAGAETFRVSGEDRSKDDLDYQGSGLSIGIGVMHAGTGSNGSALQNPSFDSAFNGAGTDKIPGWTITTGTAGNITLTTSTYYKIAPGATAGGALVFAAQAGVLEITQALSLRRIDALGERVPWMMQVAYKKSVAGSTGTMRIKIGSQTTSLDLSTIANTTWNILSFTIDKNLYYRNWKQAAPDVEIEIEDGTGGTVTIDNGLFAPWTLVDGTWIWMPGGATDFLVRDVFTVADTGPTAATSEMMYAAARAGVLPMGNNPGAILNLPVNDAGAETITDP